MCCSFSSPHAITSGALLTTPVTLTEFSDSVEYLEAAGEPYIQQPEQ
jgi:hypothetical protein